MKIIRGILIGFVLFFIMQLSVSAIEKEPTSIVYFYSSTCSSCTEVQAQFNNLNRNNSNVKLIKYNIADSNSKALLTAAKKCY